MGAREEVREIGREERRRCCQQVGGGKAGRETRGDDGECFFGCEGGG